MGSPPKQAGGGKEIKSSYVSEQILQGQQKQIKSYFCHYLYKLIIFDVFEEKGEVF